MKRFFSAVFALYLFTIVGCNKQGDSSADDTKNIAHRQSTFSDQELMSTFRDIGTVHNSGLDYIYNKLVSLSQKYLQIESGRARGQAVLDDINVYSKEFAIRNTTNLPGHYVLSGMTVKNTYCNSRQVELFDEFGVSAEMRLQLDSLFAIKSNSLSVADFEEKSEGYLIRQLQLTDSIEKKCALIISTRIYQSSARYWNSENKAKWVALYESLGFQNEGLLKPNARDVVYADAAAGIVGGLHGAIITSAAGPGGALAGFFVLGAAHALRGSAAEYLGSWVKEWTMW